MRVSEQNVPATFVVPVSLRLYTFSHDVGPFLSIGDDRFFLFVFCGLALLRVGALSPAHDYGFTAML